MELTQKLRNITATKFSFSKDTRFSKAFAQDCGALSMYDSGFGLGIAANLSGENQLRGVFLRIMAVNGIFLFNISGVNLKRAAKGFHGFEEAEYNNQITEWELHAILNRRDYLKSCIFHNGKVQFKKRILWKSIA